MTKTIDDLPSELLSEVFSYLNSKELETTRLVCKAWKQACETREVWKKHCLFSDLLPKRGFFQAMIDAKMRSLWPDDAVKRFREQPKHSVVIDGEKELLYTCASSSSEMAIWNLHDGSLQKTLDLKKEITSLHVSGDGFFILGDAFWAFYDGTDLLCFDDPKLFFLDPSPRRICAQSGDDFLVSGIKNQNPYALVFQKDEQGVPTWFQGVRPPFEVVNVHFVPNCDCALIGTRQELLQFSSHGSTHCSMPPDQSMTAMGGPPHSSLVLIALSNGSVSAYRAKCEPHDSDSPKPSFSVRHKHDNKDYLTRMALLFQCTFAAPVTHFGFSKGKIICGFEKSAPQCIHFDWEDKSLIEMAALKMLFHSTMMAFTNLLERSDSSKSSLSVRPLVTSMPQETCGALSLTGDKKGRVWLRTGEESILMCAYREKVQKWELVRVNMEQTVSADT